MPASRVKMKVSLEPQIVEHPFLCRTLSEQDLEALALLMLEAYRGTIDDEGETKEDALLVVKDTIGGSMGPFLPACSFLIERNEQVVSACLVILWKQEPLLAFAMTNPNWKSQGLVTLLLKASMNALLAQGYQELSLFVTEGNAPAQYLYKKLGFYVCDPS